MRDDVLTDVVRASPRHRGAYRTHGGRSRRTVLSYDVPRETFDGRKRVSETVLAQRTRVRNVRPRSSSVRRILRGRRRRYRR